MGKYILVRDDGAYVAKPGQAHSYTKRLEDARVFPSREAAERERCVDNERCVSLESIFSQ